MYLIGTVTAGLFGFAYFLALGSGIPALIFAIIAVSLLPHAMVYGPQAALIAECFTGRLRYSGASLGYQLASVVAGGPAPLLAAWLIATYHSPMVVAGYIGFCAVVSILALVLIPDHTGKDISAEY